ncbi:hypothetical protein SAY87_014140 [Trapa incisa]|uniref:Polygalacturonase n=1 Tax=Trapa incisa TaxID=236973 RepID=A0AAN7GZM9_9MYRT|nr:hypothetical protein SAY87_014140 [Trapa incisa]
MAAFNSSSALFVFIFFFFLVHRYLVSAATAAKYDVVALGAVPGGKAGISEALLRAWESACGSPGPSTIYVPSGRFLVEKPVEFAGPCQGGPIGIRIDGSLVAPSNYTAIGSSYSWLSFQRVSGVSISGGILDGQGSGLWKCKNSSAATNCPSGAMSLLFSNSKNIIISRLTSLNSQMFHIVMDGCQDVRVHGVKVFADGMSPNTDGIHVQNSTGVTITSSRVATGDDCVSITQGSSDVWVEDVMCGPGHGISIGSLGKRLEEEGVENVTVTSVTLTETTNGVRIKAWGRPSSGFARNIRFQNVVMNNVENPIIIDQNYCPDNINCPGQDSGVKISNVTYQNIRGTSATRVGMKFDCSTTNPCTGIRLEDVELTYKDKPAEALCVNAGGTAIGTTQPANCLGV